MKGMILNIQRFSLHDGPGIRTSVYLKGCPLKCLWCCNPESINPKKQLGYDKSLCTQCMDCVSSCSFDALQNINGKLNVDFKKCTACGECIDMCLVDALTIYGEEKTEKEVLSTVEKDIKYYKKSGGGVTFTGGEPFNQFDYLIALLKEAKSKGMHTCIETSGHSFKEDFKEAAKYTDIFLYDYKLSSEEAYIKNTSVSNKLILENLEYLNSIDAKVILRCVVIPGINDNNEHFKSITEISNKYTNILETNLLPYHDFARKKYEQIGVKYTLEQTTVKAEVSEKWLKELINMGCKNVKIV